ncbi:MAG TPA: hypothetical protein VE397_13515 [Stellaceae bacterium]|jgi:hypothetical protein|nr:hypothetical protein [Stellaceae bacterium]
MTIAALEILMITLLCATGTRAACIGGDIGPGDQRSIPRMSSQRKRWPNPRDVFASARRPFAGVISRPGAMCFKEHGACRRGVGIDRLRGPPALKTAAPPRLVPARRRNQRRLKLRRRG